MLGPDRFIASGHPDPQTPGPPLLGLIASEDAGREWRSVVFEGRADFHVIRSGGKTFYAQDASHNRMFEGRADGSGLSERKSPPGTTLDLAVDARRPNRVFATTDRGFFFSRDSARRWKRVDRRRTGLIAFVRGHLVMIDGGSQVSALSRLGLPWRAVGALPDGPVALASDGRTLVAAVADGTVLASSDGGRTWRPRIDPAWAVSSILVRHFGQTLS